MIISYGKFTSTYFYIITAKAGTFNPLQLPKKIRFGQEEISKEKVFELFMKKYPPQCSECQNPANRLYNSAEKGKFLHSYSLGGSSQSNSDLTIKHFLSKIKMASQNTQKNV